MTSRLPDIGVSAELGAELSDGACFVGTAWAQREAAGGQTNKRRAGGARRLSWSSALPGAGGATTWD